MKIDTPVHAEHQLDQLAGQFAQWRQTRTQPSERIPEPLWHQAVALTPALSPSRVAKHLRLCVTDLKKQIAIRHGATAAEVPASPGFVELPPPPSWPQDLRGLEVELHRPDGARLRMYAPDASLPLSAIVHCFLEAR